MDLADAVYNETQVDLLPDDNDPSQVVGLLFARKKLGTVLWACCREQATVKQIDQKSFRSGLDGDALTNGWGALVDGIAFFIQTQSPKMAEAYLELVEAQMRVVEAGASKFAATLKSSQTSQAIDQAVNEMASDLQSEVTEALGNSVTKSREESQLRRAHSR